MKFYLLVYHSYENDVHTRLIRLSLIFRHLEAVLEQIHTDGPDEYQYLVSTGTEAMEYG